MNPANLSGLKVTVMGLGLFGGGAGVTRYLVDQGAVVTVTDLRDADLLSKSLAQIEDLPVRLVLGGHDQRDFIDTDLVVVNPAVHPNAPFLLMAKENGVKVESEMNLTLKNLDKMRIIGVTGSNGKTTTSCLTYEILKGAGKKVWLGGNMGGSLLPKMHKINQEDIVVLEMSSFQLEMSGLAGLGPDVGIVTNITPNHLDRHNSFEEYIDAKLQIFVKANIAVLNANDEVSVERLKKANIRKIYFSSKEDLEEGYFISDNSIVERIDGNESQLINIKDVKLPGVFNLENIMAALASARAISTPEVLRESACNAAARFKGVPHRLEIVVTRDGVKYINDSIATTPESCLAALDAVEGDIHLIAGGYDKGVALNSLGEGVVKRTKSVYLLGATASKLNVEIQKAIDRLGIAAHQIKHVKSLETAVKDAARCAKAGSTVLLSPGFASYDQFVNFEERGECFRKSVEAL